MLVFLAVIAVIAVVAYFLNQYFGWGLGGFVNDLIP